MRFDSEMIAVMRSVVDDTCRHIPASENRIRTYVANAILECADTGERFVDALKSATNIALLEVHATRDSCGHAQSFWRLGVESLEKAQAWANSAERKSREPQREKAFQYNSFLMLGHFGSV